ncbi:MAG: fasciclin domain-containing protein [Bacteroidota bacterium]
MKANIKNIFLAAAIGGFITVTATSCKKDDPAPTPVSNTITDQVVAGATFSTLEAAVIKAGLAATLSGTGPFTVFAPDNAAFTASGITSIDPLTADQLKKILLYHTLASKVVAADVPAGPNAKVATANSPADSIFVTKNASGVYVNGIKVTTADVMADNGVIHVMSKVLLPPSGNIVATAQANLGGDNGLDSLVNAIVRADAASPGLIALINSNVLTVFAPTNKAFRDLLTALGLSNINAIPIATLSAVLTYHVKAGRAFSSDLANGSLAMFAGGNTTIAVSGAGATIKGNTNPAASNIIATNIMAYNGVVHVIDRVLIP